METQVLIPPEFSLVLTAPGGKKSREQVATVFTTARIPQGTVLYPFQGTVRTDKLDVYAYLDEHDVSCFPMFSQQVSGSTCPLNRTKVITGPHELFILLGEIKFRLTRRSTVPTHPPMTAYGNEK